MEEFIMILERVIELVANELSVSKEELGMTTHLQNDLNADSLDAVELVMSIEEEFELEIDDEASQKLLTIGDIVNYIESHK
jgi:acyl carrier protein